MTVDELTEGHIGWLIQVTEPAPRPLGPPRRDLVLIGIRKWTYQGHGKVGLTAPKEGWAGQEHIYPAETPCEVLRQVRKPRKRRRAA